VVAGDALDGGTSESRYDGVTARLLMHEVDHLDGILYPERMPAAERLIPVDEYRGLVE
jgi:peptide deformylase